MTHRRTKIVCTIGPASSSVSMLSRMMQGGMDAARLNFSHGTHAEHKQLLKHLRAAAKKSHRTVAILQDLQGPKMRIGVLPGEGLVLRKGQRVDLTTANGGYHKDGPVPVAYKALHKDVKKGHRLFLDDGQIVLEVTSVRGRVLLCKVSVAGILKSHKGINAPDSHISATSFTEKDHADLQFGIENGVDWVALSFVRSAADVESARRTIAAMAKRAGMPTPALMAKIETRAAVDAFHDILASADGIMLARGDLGVEIHPAEVPIIQKEFAEICRQSGKPMIIATHMLDAMTHHVLPTRAEASDVANAVIDHADALMLSQETATGDYPDRAVKMMAAIIAEAEASRLDDIIFYQIHDLRSVPASLAQTLHVMAENGQISAIVSSVSYGLAADAINTFRPNVPIYLAAPNAAEARKAVLRAGVFPIVEGDAPGTFVQRMAARLRNEKRPGAKGRVAFVTVAPNGSAQLTVTG